MKDKELKYRLLNYINIFHQRSLVNDRLELPYSTLRDHCDEIEENGLIKREQNTNPIWYDLTDTGKAELDVLGAKFSQGGEDSQLTLAESKLQKLWILHHFTLKYPIIKDAPIHMNLEIAMNNWTKQIDEWKLFTVEKTTKHIIIHAKELYGTEPYELLDRARRICDKMVGIYEGNFGMEFGRSTQVGKAQYETNDPFCMQFSKHFTIEYNACNSTSYIDASKLEGEIGFDNPKNAKEYLKMPTRVKKIEEKVGEIKSDLKSLDEKIEILRANEKIMGEGMELILDKMQVQSPKDNYQLQKERKQDGIENQ